VQLKVMIAGLQYLLNTKMSLDVFVHDDYLSQHLIAYCTQHPLVLLAFAGFAEYQ